MSKARILADLISDSQITASEITGLELNAIQEGDTIVEVSDDGSGGKVVVRVDGADNAEFNANGMVIPKGTTAQRDPAAVVGSLRYNTTTGFFETFTSSGWGAVATPPSITSIAPSNFNGEAGATFTVNGAFFDADTVAVFKGSNGIEYAAATVTFVNNSQITLTNATNLPVADEPFRVKVTNGAGLSVESTQGIDAGSVPAFTTAAGTLATTTQWNEAVSVTVNATDAENTITGYSITEGNLPAGLSLNATTGAITGTSTEQATTTYTFTIGATDSAGNTNTRQFNIQIVNAAPVWSSPAEGGTEELAVTSAGSITLSATDPEGEAVSYTSGALPTGLSLSGNVISGTPTVTANTSVAVTASDGFASSVRNFFINVIQPPLILLFGDNDLTPQTTTGNFDFPSGTVYYAIMGGGGSGAATHYPGGGSGFGAYGSFSWGGGIIRAEVGGRSGFDLNSSDVNLDGIDGQNTIIRNVSDSSILVQANGGGGGGGDIDADGFSGGGGAGNQGFGGAGGYGGRNGDAGATYLGGAGQGTSFRSDFYTAISSGLTANSKSNISISDGSGGAASGGTHQGGGGGGGIQISYTGSSSNPSGLAPSITYGGQSPGEGGAGWGGGGGASGYNGGRGSTGNGAAGFAILWM